MMPSSRPKWGRNKRNSMNSNGIAMDIQFKNGSCPAGTVLIKRNNQDDFFHTKLLQQRYDHLGLNSSYSDNSQDTIYFAIAQSKVDPTNSYYGVGATITIFNPRVEPSQYSATEIIIKGGSDTIVAGWTVNPGALNDNKTRFYANVAAKGMHCFNSECGFVSIRSDVALGAAFQQMSKFGATIFVNSFYIFQDPKTGNWWLELEVGGNNTAVGFWPRQMFEGLYDSASYVACGGEVYRPVNTGVPDMGSGYYPIDSQHFNSYCHDIIVIDKGHKPVYADGFTQPFSSDDSLYEVSQKSNRYVVYGGPHTWS